MSGLTGTEVARVHEMVGRSILWALHKRLDVLRLAGRLTLEHSHLLQEIEQSLAHPTWRIGQQQARRGRAGGNDGTPPIRGTAGADS